MSNGDGGGSSIRLRGETYRRLKDIKREDETMLEALNKVIPDDLGKVEKIERPHDKVVALPTPSDLSKRINNLAGQNVSASDVVDQFIERHQEES